VVLVAVLTFVPTSTASTESGTLTFGAFPGPRNGQSLQQAVVALENQIGRELDAVRAFYRWDAPFPTSYESWLRDTGRTLFMSVKAIRMNGAHIRWADVAAAPPGSPLYTDIVRWAARVRDYGAPVYFVFHPEPENVSNDVNGTSTDFIAAWRRVISIFRGAGVTNASYVWTMTDYSFWRTDHRRAALWYPGDEYVDHIAADAYNWFTCRGNNTPWWSLQQIIEPLRQFGLAHPSEGLMLLEFGSAEDPAVPGRKAQWFRDVQALFKQPGWEQFQAILYFNTVHPPFPNCRWWVDTSQSSLDAFRALANDPFFGGANEPDPGPTVVFSDDFSTADFSRWSGLTNLSIDATSGGTAPPSARAQASATRARAYRLLGSTHTELCQTMRLNIASIGTNNVDMLRLRTATDGPIARVYVSAARTLWIRSDASGQQLSSGRALPLGWNTLQLCAAVGFQGSLTMSLNGTVVAGPWSANLGTVPIGRVEIGDGALKTWTGNVDDVLVTSQA
jgi:hypothetical protein